MPIVRELITKLGFITDEKKLDDFEKRTKKLKDGLRGFSRAARRVGRSLTLFVTGPIVGMGVAFVKAASDAEETGNRFREVFKGLEESSQSAADALSKNFGLSRTAAQELLATTGDLLTGFKFNREEALDLSDQVQRLAVDIASFKNVQGGAQRASMAITRALLGEREMLKTLGTAILEADVKAKVLLLRQEGQTFATERQAKAFATLQLIIEQNRDAIGDFARTSTSTANQMRIFRGRLNDVAVSFGTILLPVANKVLGIALNFLEFLETLSPTTRKVILIIGGLVAAIGPLITGVGLLAFALASVNTQLLLIPILVVAALAAIALIVEDIVAFTRGKDSLFGRMLEGFRALWTLAQVALTQAFTRAWETIRTEGLAIWEDIVTRVSQLWADFFDNRIQPILDALEQARTFVSAVTTATQTGPGIRSVAAGAASAAAGRVLGPAAQIAVNIAVSPPVGTSAEGVARATASLMKSKTKELAVGLIGLGTR